MAIALATTVAACQSDSDKLTDGDIEPVAVLKLERRPYFRFCPDPGRISKAEVSRNRNGKYTLRGSILIEGDASKDSCHEFSDLAQMCLVEVTFDSRTLTRRETLEFEALLSELPHESCAIHGAWDMCLVTYYEFDGHTVVSGPCQDGWEQYLTSLRDLDSFLENLIADSR
jgi:hypothetical protein